MPLSLTWCSHRSPVLPTSALTRRRCIGAPIAHTLAHTRSTRACRELVFDADDVIDVIRDDIGEGWWEGSLNGVSGLLPASYVELIESAPAAPPVPPPMMPAAPPAAAAAEEPDDGDWDDDSEEEGGWDEASDEEDEHRTPTMVFLTSA